MKIKKLLIGFLLLLLPLTCSGDWYSDAYELMIAMPKFPAGMTYLAIYNDELLDADRSGGVPTSTFAAARDADHPATYFNSAGVMQVTTTNNVGRFNHGYYDTTGWHAFSDGAGLMIESASTNYLKQGIFAAGVGTATNWTIAENDTNEDTATLVDISDTFNVGTTVQSQRIEMTFAGDGTFLLLVSDHTGDGTFDDNDVVTGSCWIKGSSSGLAIKLNIIEYDIGEAQGTSHVSGDFASSISSTEWRRFTYAVTVTDDDISQVTFGIDVSGIDAADTMDLQIACFQGEKSPFATSFIPTTVAALTRNAETNKYVTLGNRTAAVESCVVKLAPNYANNITATNTYIISSDTKNRLMRFDGGNDVDYKPNPADSPLSTIEDLINDDWTAFDEMTLGYTCQYDTSPYVAGYWNGVADGTNETTNGFTAALTGTYWWLGTNKGAEQLNGTIFSIAFFDRVLSDAEMLFLHEKDWRTLR